MTIQESGEMYLETILILSKEKKCVRSIDIANYTKYSKPSVSRAVGILKKEGFIQINPLGHIELTQKGQETSEKIYERHVILTKFFITIGVDEKIASDDACKIEHHISDESFNKIKEFLVNNNR